MRWNGAKVRRHGRSAAFLGLAAWLVIDPTLSGTGDSPTRRAIAATDAPRPGDDATYRPTVMIRKGKALGTGTMIASVEDETLVLTASHVVEGSGPIHVELFRYNMGLERTRDATG